MFEVKVSISPGSPTMARESSSGKLAAKPPHAQAGTLEEYTETGINIVVETGDNQEQARRQSLAESSRAAQRAVELAQNQYTSGLIDFQIVLDAQRALLSLQDQLAQSEGAVTSNLIRLYKALGGGWTALAPASEN